MFSKLRFPASSLLLLSVLLLPERPTDPPDAATLIVTGTVKKVFGRDSGHNKESIVQIKIDGIEKGTGYEIGDLVYAYCFQRKPNVPITPSASGHHGVPKEKQRIRAKIKYRNGEMEGLYPDWFKVLEPISTGPIRK